MNLDYSRAVDLYSRPVKPLNLDYSSVMSKVKEVIHSKAKRNIDAAQKKDKLYYDSKHASSEVCTCMYLNATMISQPEGVSSYWVRNLGWRDDDKVAIVENGMLSDRHMYVANKLMALQFPGIDGFHSTLLAQSTGFPPISIGGSYMQDGNI